MNLDNYNLDVDFDQELGLLKATLTVPQIPKAHGTRGYTLEEAQTVFLGLLAQYEHILPLLVKVRGPLSYQPQLWLSQRSSRRLSRRLSQRLSRRLSQRSNQRLNQGLNQRLRKRKQRKPKRQQMTY